MGTGVNPNGILNGATAAVKAAKRAAKIRGFRFEPGIC